MIPRRQTKMNINLVHPSIKWFIFGESSLYTSAQTTQFKISQQALWKGCFKAAVFISLICTLLSFHAEIWSQGTALLFPGFLKCLTCAEHEPCETGLVTPVCLCVTGKLNAPSGHKAINTWRLADSKLFALSASRGWSLISFGGGFRYHLIRRAIPDNSLQRALQQHLWILCAFLYFSAQCISLSDIRCIVCLFRFT